MIAHTQKKGFTLIELLVVIAIIGFLSSVVLVSMGSTREKARDSKRMSDMRQIVSAQALFYANPANIRYYECGNVAGGGDCGTANWPSSISIYMPKVPRDPKNTGSNIYIWADNTPGTATSFCAYAVLEIKESCANTRYYTASQVGNSDLCSATVPSLGSCF